MRKKVKFKELNTHDKIEVVVLFIAYMISLLFFGVVAAISLHSALIVITILLGVHVLNTHGIVGSIYKEVEEWENTSHIVRLKNQVAII